MGSLYESIADKTRRKDTTLEIVSEVYGDRARDGFKYKLGYSHPSDVLDHAHLEGIYSSNQSSEIFRCCLLHDVFYESQMTEKELVRRVDVSKDELEILRLQTRKFKNKDGSSYIDGILTNESATVVKMADRIACMDYLCRIAKRDSAFEKKNRDLATLYLEENKRLMDGIESSYSEQFLDKKHALSKQYRELEVLHNDLSSFMGNTNESIDEKAKVKDGGVLKDRVLKDQISKDDFDRAKKEIVELYNKSEHLQNAYPDFLDRLKDTFNQIERIISKKGYEYFEELTRKVSFDDKDYLEAYKKEINERVYNHLMELKNMKEATPKDGMLEGIGKELRISVPELREQIKSKDEKVVKSLFDAITKIMDKDFDILFSGLKGLAEKRFKGKLDARPGKYKKFKSAYDKFLEKVGKDPKYGTDFLDLKDILGMRAEFTPMDEMVDFALGVVRDRSNIVFGVDKSVGLAKAYQGINMDVNYKNRFNYELQSVMKKMQVATDINHDVFYKKVMQMSESEKEIVADLVQICLASVLFDLIDLGDRKVV